MAMTQKPIENPPQWTLLFLIALSSTIYTKNTFSAPTKQIANTSSQAVKEITLKDIETPIPLAPQQQIRLPFTLKQNEFAVLLLTHKGIQTNAYMINAEQSDEKPKKISRAQFKDLYQRERLFIHGEQCQQCILVVDTKSRLPNLQKSSPTDLSVSGIESGQLNITFNRHNRTESIMQFNAEQHMHDAFITQITTNTSSNTPLNGSVKKDVFEEVFIYYEKALHYWKQLDNHTELKNAYYLSADAASGFSNEKSRPNYFNILKELAQKDNDFFAQGIAHLRLGRYAYTLGNHKQARDYYNTVLSFAQKISPSSRQPVPHKFITQYKSLLNGHAYHELGQLNTTQDKYPQAKKELKQALKYYQDSSMSEHKAQVFNTLGLLARRQNQLNQAANYHQQAYALNYHNPHGGARMRTLYYMAIVNAIQGRYFHALEMLTKAEQAAETLSTLHWQAHILAAKARINMELGRLEQSLALYQKTRAMYEQVDAQVDLRTVALNMGKLYSLLGDVEHSRHNFTLATQEGEQINPEHKIKLLTAKVTAYIKQQQYDLALTIQQQVSALLSVSENNFAHAQSLTQTAQIYDALEKYNEAFPLLKRAQKLQEKNGDDLGYARTNYLLAKSSASLKHPLVKTQQYLDNTKYIIEKIRDNLHRDNIRQQFFALQKEIYELEAKIYNQTSPIKNIVNALYSAEQFKSRTLYESLQSQSSSMDRTAKGRNTQDEITLLDNSFTIKNRHATSEYLKQTSFTKSQINTYRKNIAKDTAVLYFFTGREDSYLWVLTNDHTYTITLPSAETLDSYITPLFTELSSFPKGNLDKKLWHRLHTSRQNVSQVLLQEAMPLIAGYKSLLIIPDGPLHKIPFSALYNPQTQKPLLLSHTFNYAPSLAIEHHLKQKSAKAKTETNKHNLLMVANPQGKITTLFPDTQLSLKTRNNTLSALPFATKEANNIVNVWQRQKKKLADTLHADVLMGKNATKAQLHAMPLSDYEVIHFATHAVVNWDYPSLSAIALATETNNTPTVTSKNLSVQDISQWQVNAEMAVLSGCDTASGKTMLGEGPLGLSRAFFKAGVKRIVASIWPVEDEASAFLMTKFYHALFIDGHPPANALRQARLAVSQIPRWSHPYYWSGFLFFGNGGHWREL